MRKPYGIESSRRPVVSEYVALNLSGMCGRITKVYHNYVRANKALTRSRLIAVQLKDGGAAVQENFFPSLAHASEKRSMRNARIDVTFMDGRKKQTVIFSQVRRAQPVSQYLVMMC